MAGLIWYNPSASMFCLLQTWLRCPYRTYQCAGHAVLSSGRISAASADMEEGRHDHMTAEPASNGLSPRAKEDRGGASGFLLASESAQHAQGTDEDNLPARDCSDSDVPAASVFREADAALGSEHAAAPASTGTKDAIEHSLTAQVLQQAAITAQLPAVSSLGAGASGKGKAPEEVTDSRTSAASILEVLPGTSPARGPASREALDTITQLRPSQAEQGLPVPTAAGSALSQDGPPARVTSTTQAARSAAVLAPSEAQLVQPASSAVSGSYSTEANQAASLAALLAPDLAAGGEEGAPTGAVRTSALLPPSKAQLKRARRAAAMQRSSQGTPQAAGRKRAWQDWLAHRSGWLSAYHQLGACLFFHYT